MDATVWLYWLGGQVLAGPGSPWPCGRFWAIGGIGPALW
jgi:hypothetical protein